MDPFWALLALLCIASTAFLSKIRRPEPKLLPGPKPWPVIGNLLLIGPVPHITLHSLSRKYGELMLLKFGKSPVVVASSPDMAKQFLKTHDAVFASRPSLSAGKYASYNYSDMTWAPYGPQWRQARKIYLSEVFNAKSLDSFEHVRVDERANLISQLFTRSGKPVVLREHLMRYTLSTTCRMFVSEKIFERSGVSLDELQGLLDEWFFLSGVVNIGDWVPWLNFLDLQGYVKQMKTFKRKIDGFLSHVIDDRKAMQRSTKKDVVDVLLRLAEDTNLDLKMTRDRVKALLQNLLVGGTDTTATTVEWAILEILMHPNAIERAKDELDRVIGRNRWVEEKDFSRLPYIESIVKETLRLHPLATLLAPHYSLEDCNVTGYHVPKGTMVLINTWSIGRDPRVWDEPEKFCPERFLGNEVDMLGSNFALLPFGSGRRRCPGYDLGLRMVRTTLANLVHGFDFRLTEGMSRADICMEEEYGLTTHPKVRVSVIMEPTLPSHLY